MSEVPSVDTVVDHDHLAIATLRQRRGQHAFEHLRQEVALVVDRDDDGDLHGSGFRVYCTRAGPGPRVDHRVSGARALARGSCVGLRRRRPGAAPSPALKRPPAIVGHSHPALEHLADQAGDGGVLLGRLSARPQSGFIGDSDGHFSGRGFSVARKDDGAKGKRKRFAARHTRMGLQVQGAAECGVHFGHAERGQHTGSGVINRDGSSDRTWKHRNTVSRGNPDSAAVTRTFTG